MSAARQADMFGKPKRKSPRVLAHVVDAGEGMAGYPFGAQFKCNKCDWTSKWLYFDNPTEPKHGIPCEQCNAKAEGTTHE